MKNIKIATAAGLLVLAVLIVVAQYKDTAPPSPTPPPAEQLARESIASQQGSIECVAASLAGHPRVHGLGVDFPLVPNADRITYGDLGNVQYRADLQPEEILGFYYDRVVNALCGRVLATGPHTATYQVGDAVVKVEVSTPLALNRSVIGFALLNARKILGESVQLAQADTSACTGDQIRCYSSDGSSSWCQASPCPTYTPPSTGSSTTCPSGQSWCSVTNTCIGPSDSCSSSPGSTVSPSSSTACTGGMTWCASSSSSGGWCQYPPCPSSTSTTGTASVSSCSGAYQQSGSTYPSCNYSTCPNGCTWGSDGCPSGCYTSPTCSGEYQQPGSTYPSCNNAKCPSGCNWSNGCPTGCYAAPVCSGTFAMPGTSSCNYATCPNGCSWDSTGCPSGCYTPQTCTGDYQQPGSTYPMCNYSKCPNGCNYGSNGCPSSCMATCPSGQYSCNGACVANSTSCGTAGGGTTCPSNQYWCNGVCVATGTTCSSTGTAITQATCESGGGLWCQPTTAPHCHNGPNPTPCEPDTVSGTYCQLNQYWCNGVCVPMGTTCTPNTTTSCPTGQYMCNGVCVANTASCTSVPWPSTQAECTAGGKYWCTSPSGFAGGSAWCQSTPCAAPTPTTCAAGTFWCSYTQACVSTQIACVPPPPNPQPVPQPQIQCGQCQIAQNGQCVKAPAGTADSRCGTGAVCDQYGGCVTLSGSRKFVGNGAICGDRFCSPELGENKENCPNECQNDPWPVPKPIEPGQPLPPVIIEPGPNEEEMSRMRQRDFELMKKNVEQFAKGVERMRDSVKRTKTKLNRQGVGIPVGLENALSRAPELLAKLRAAKTFEEFELVMQDVQDIAMELNEWRTRIGDLERLAGMLTQMSRDVRRMGTEFNLAKARAKGKAELQEPFKRLEALFGVLSKRAADARKLAKDDPEQSLELADAFYEDSQDFWSQVSLLNMLRDVRKSLALANTETARAVRRVDQFARVKGTDPALIVELRALLQQIKDVIPELRTAINAKPLDFELVQGLAEQFQELIREFEGLMAENGRGQYVPIVQRGAEVDIMIPEGFLPQVENPPSSTGSPGTASQ